MNKKIYNNQKKPIQLIIKRQLGTDATPPNPNKNPLSDSLFILIVGFAIGIVIDRVN